MYKYDKILEKNNIRLNAISWISIAVIISLIVAIILGILMSNIVIAIISFFAIADTIIGYPIFKEQKRISEIEKYFPLALKEMADILKGGGTYEFALKEVSKIDYGPLTKEFKKVLHRIEDGDNFEKALQSVFYNMGSDLVKKVSAIIIDAVRSGAGLADVLNEIAEDSRNLYRLQQERKAKTTMQVLFVILASSIIAPAIFALVITLASFLIEVSTKLSVSKIAEINKAISVKSIINNSLLFYLFFEVFVSSFIIAYMRDNKAYKAIIYLPIMLLVAIFIFYSAQFVIKNILMSMI